MTFRNYYTEREQKRKRSGNQVTFLRQTYKERQNFYRVRVQRVFHTQEISVGMSPWGEPE